MLRLFENKVLREIFGLKKEEEVRGWRRLYIKEHHNLYALPNIISMIKSKRLIWVEHVACSGRCEKFIQNFSQKT
jgi:hypothetical protein